MKKHQGICRIHHLTAKQVSLEIILRTSDVSEKLNDPIEPRNGDLNYLLLINALVAFDLRELLENIDGIQRTAGRRNYSLKLICQICMHLMPQTFPEKANPFLFWCLDMFGGVFISIKKFLHERVSNNVWQRHTFIETQYKGFGGS